MNALTQEMNALKQGLLIVDVQNEYFPGGKSELDHPIKALQNIEKILAAFREGHLPVIFIQHISHRSGAGSFLADTDGVLIHKTISPQPGEYLVIKHAPNSFFETNLLEIINTNQLNHLVICGMMSHMCIDSTVRACRDYGLGVTLLEDACATKSLTFNGRTIPAQMVHDAFMAALDGAFARVITTSEFILKTQQ